MKSGSKTAKTAIVLIIMVATVMALYHYMVNKVKSQEPESTTTMVQDVLLKNLSISYPTTPREVLKYYNQIMECYYNEDYTEEELVKLADKAMELYDDELVENQDDVQYMANLKAEIEKYKSTDMVISSAAISSSTDVEYYTYENRECAQIRCVYTLRQGTSLMMLSELYVMRKDEDGHWKILGWDVCEDDNEAVE